MKLHLPSGLRKALMACLAAVAFALPTTLSSASLGAGALAALALAQQAAYGIHVTEHTTEEGGKTYSGYIIDIKDDTNDSGVDFHKDTFYVNGIPAGSGTEIDGEATKYTKNPDSDADSTTVENGTNMFWKNWTGVGEGTGTFCHTLRMGNSEHGDTGAGEHVYDFSFGDNDHPPDGPGNLTLGGLIVEANASGGTYKLYGSGTTQRNINLRSGESVSVLFTIGSDTTISSQIEQQVNVFSNAVFEVAGGKSLIWSNYRFNIVSGNSLTIKGQGSVTIDKQITSSGWLNLEEGTQTSVAAALTISDACGVNISRGAHLTLSGEHESSIAGNLNLGTGELVLQDTGTQLTVTGSLLGFSSTSGSISGNGTLKLVGGVTGASLFTGSITGVAVEYAAEGAGTLSGLFAGKSLTVSGAGVLTLGNVKAAATKDDAGVFTVSNGGLTIAGVTAPVGAASQVYVAKEISLAAGKTLTVGHNSEGISAVIGKLKFDNGANLALTSGKWTLSEVSRISESAGQNRLTLSGSGTLNFSKEDGSAVGLTDGITLVLGSGITYAGGLSIAVGDDTGSNGAKLGVGTDLTDLGALTITLTGLSEKTPGNWTSGYDLFVNPDGGDLSLSEEVLAALEGSLKSDASRQYRLKLDTSGKVTLVESSALTWSGGASGSWTEDGAGWTKGSEAVATNYESNADVIFEALSGSAQQTVNVSGTVHARDFYVGNEDAGDTKNGVFYTFSGEGATIDISGNIDFAGTYADGDATSPSKALFNTGVNFSGGEGNSITGTGTATFAGGITGQHGLTVDGGEVYITGGEANIAGVLSVTNGGMVSVGVSTAVTARTFGGITLDEGSTFVWDGTAGEGGLTVVQYDTVSGGTINSTASEASAGHGTMVLKGINGGAGHDNSIKDFLNHHLAWDATTEAERKLPRNFKLIDVLVLESGTQVAVGTDQMTKAITSIGTIKIGTGTKLIIGSPTPLTQSASPNIEIADGGTLASWDWNNNNSHNVSASKQITVLGDSATISSGGANNGTGTTLTLSGELLMAGKTVNKTGKGTLSLTGTITSDTSSVLDIQAGVVQITSSSFTAGEVKLSADTHFKLGGGGSATYAVDKLTIGGTAVGNNEDNIEPSVYVDFVMANGAVPTLNVGTLNIEHNGRLTGSGGTLKVTTAVTGGQHLRVEGATLDVSEATEKSMTGGVYLYDGASLKIGDSWEMACLAGTTGTSGKSITTTVGSSELTLTGGGGVTHIVYDLAIGANITLKLAENTSQNFRHLTSEGALELGSGASTTFVGRSTANVGNSTKDITNEGSIQVGGSAGSQGGELTVNGDLSSSGAGSISVGVAGESYNTNLLTVNGNIEHNSTGNISVENDRSTLTVTGTITGTGTGTLLLRNGKLNVQGGTAGGAGYNGMLNLQGASVLTLGDPGSDAKGYLIVAGLQNETDQTGQQTITGNGTLELNVAENGDEGVNGAGMNIQLGGSTTLKKSGAGIQKLSRLSTSGENAKVHVTGGTLQIVALGQGEAVLSVGNLVVEGAGAKLDLAVSGLTASDTNITLSGGGTLSNSATGATHDAPHNFNFGKLILGGGAANLTLGDYQNYNFNVLTAVEGSTLSIGDDSTLLGTGTGRSISLGILDSFSGTISGKVAEGNHLYIDEAISTGDVAGSISLDGGSVELRSGGGVLKKTGGEGRMTISDLKLTSGQGLNMNYAGGELTIESVGFEGGVRLVYDAETYDGRNSLVTLKISEIGQTLKDLGENDRLIIDANGIDPKEAPSIYLGIISETDQTDPSADYYASKLQKYFEGHFTFDGSTTTVEGVDLTWDEADGKWWLKATLLNAEEAHRYWDENWDEPGVTPYNKDMAAHGDAWYKAPTDEEGASGLWSTEEWQAKDQTAGNFAGVTLDLSGETRDTWNHNNTLSLRLDVGSGSSKDDTLLTIIGGKLDDNSESAGTATTVNGGVYLSLWANETDHFHMLVGGSAFRATNRTAGSFTGNTHIQVQGGTVDYLVGGNHLSSGGATFAGNTYISVYEGGRLRDPETGDLSEELQNSMRSVVRGGIVGGSTITMSSATGETGEGATVDFKGRTHINIYTVLQTYIGMPSIDDEKSVYFSHIVGGNAWVTVPSGTKVEALSPTFYGSSDISIDLREYQGKYTGQSPTGYDEYDFLKGIVGGNYSAGGNAEGGARNTVFRYDSSEEDKHSYGSHVAIFGHSVTADRDITFHAGVNGASRRDTSGRGTTTYEGDTLVEIHGGTFVNYVAGGFWFGGATQDDTSGQVKPIEDSVNKAELTGDTSVELEISDEEGAGENVVGTYWRVVGGSVNRYSADGSSGTHSGNSSLNIGGGNFNARNGAVGIVAGGSYYEQSHGTYTQTGYQTLTIAGGDYDNVRIVAGDYAVMQGEKTEIKLSGAGRVDEDGTQVATKLTIDGEDTSIRGLVIGGGYMEDAGKGGNLTIDGSAELTINGGSIKAIDPSVTAGKDRIAVVAGSVLIDSGDARHSGDHTVEITGGTKLTINEGNITGFVVGGSYANDSAGRNNITIGGNSTIKLLGGTITGNVVGGHYSDNTAEPDQLSLGNVDITVDGTSLDGYIFGGSFRRALTPVDGEAPTQGEITITLKNGSVAGGVYAAGNHYNAGKQPLHVHTDSTKIEITGDIEIKASQRFEQASGGEVILSGGYMRAIDGEGHKNDYSTVGYKSEGEWNPNAAVLAFSEDGTDDSFSNLQQLGSNLYLQDFDTIDVHENLNVELSEAKMRVMHKVIGDKEIDQINHDTFTKGGQGNLTLGKLASWNAQKGAEEAYTGKIILGGGTLTLEDDYDQSLVGGLEINMNGRVSGNVDAAYLKGTGTMFTGLREGKGIELTLVAREFELGQDLGEYFLTPGVYYLIDGLDMTGIDEEGIEEYFDLDINKNIVVKNEDATVKTELGIRDGDKLVLRIHKDDPNEWRWEGDEDGSTWKANATENFTKEQVDDEAENRIYIFDAGAADGEGPGKSIRLQSGIRAKEIHVESGDYTFKLRNGGTGLSVDTIQIGAVGTANLTLAMETSRVGSVELLEGGRLTLADEGAIRKGQEGTKIVFDGGTLAYGEDKHGDLLVAEDYSSQAKLAQNYSGALRIQVGDEVSEEKPVETDPNKDVTWSENIDLAVSKGIIKSGRMNFTLDWTPTEEANAFEGTLDAQGGVLTLKVNGSQATINGNAALAAAKGATVELIAGEGGSLIVERGATGEGTIAIGSATAENQGSYILNTSVDNAFAGTVKLAGDGANSTVDVRNVAALGKKANPENGVAGSTLALAGRAIVVSESGATISAETITVEKDTTNFLGGYKNLTDPNKAITLEAGDGGIAVEGVLANVGGGVNHTLEGTLSGGGMIVAGYKGRGTVEESTWTLAGTQVGDVTTGFAGTGKIIVAYGDVVESAPEGAKAAEEKQKVVRLTGIIGDAERGDSVALENGMTGIALAIADGNDGKTYNTSTGDLVFNGNEIWLGDDDGTAGSWSGTTLTGTDGGVFRLKSGALKGAIGTKNNVKLVVDTAAAGATVDAGGTDGSRFDEININAGGHLTNVNGDIEVGSGETKMALTFDENSIGRGKGTPEQYLISTNEGDLNVRNTVEEDEKGSEEDPRANDAFSLDVTAEALIDMVTEHRAEGVASYLHAVTDGVISFKGLSDEALNTLLRSGNYTGLLHDLGWTLGVDGGDLTLLGSSAKVYLVLKDDNDPRGDKATVASDEDAETLRGKKATLLDSGTTLTLKMDELTDEKEVDVNNLVGLSGSTLRATGRGTVNLNNARWDDGVPNEDKKWLGDEGFDDKTLESLKGQNTDFYGCIVGENDANFNKKGAGTLTVGDGTFKALAIDGDLKLSGGDFVVRSGAGEYSSTLGSLTFAYGKDATVGDGFVVKGGRIEVGAIVEEAGSKEQPIDANKNKVTLADGGIFAFTGKMAEADEEAETLTSTKFGGAGTLEIGGEEGEDGARLVLGSGDGTNAAIGGDLNVQLGSNGILKLKGGATMDAGEVALAGTLDMSAMAAPGTAQSLIGDGTLKGSESNTKLTIAGTPGDEAKAFGGTLEGGGTLTVGSGAEWRIKGLQTTKPGDEKDGKWNLEVALNGTLDVTLQRGRVANLGDVTLGDNSTLFYHYNNEAGHDARTLLTGELKVADENTKANLKVDMTNFVPGRDGVTDLTLGGLKWTNKDLRLEDHLSVTLEGAGKQYFTPSAKIDDDSVVYVDFTHTTKNLYRHADQEKNAAAGAELFWGVDDPLTPLGKDLRDRQKDGEWTDLYKFATALGSQYEGKNIDSMLAAGAGASISALGQALGDDLHRQINSIRNRTTVMGAEARYDQYDVLPLYHMWVNGETGYHKLDSDGLAPGYTLNSWGGTLGLEMDVTRNVTVGLALSAMYGDLKTEAADSGSGDLDTTYMSAFMSARRGAWRHTVVLSGGMADVKFNRTVGYSTSTIFGAMPGSYKTSGSTDGYAVGALYEIGYTRMANAAGTVAVQPVFNVEYRRVGINGYTEAGSDAALRVDDITQDSITFGAGARVQALTGGNVFNRSAIFEGRALLKVEAGDRSGKAINAIVNTQKTAELESAEVGAVGVEVGAGITIPLGSTEGSIFIDGSLELRSGYTSMDATVGYRVSF